MGHTESLRQFSWYDELLIPTLNARQKNEGKLGGRALQKSKIRPLYVDA